MRNLFLFLSLLFVISSYGQITITSDDIYGSGSWANIASVPGVPPGFDPAAVGPDQVWDYSGFMMDTSYHVLFLDPSETPYGEYFPESNIAMSRISYLDSTYIFGLTSDSAYKNVGLAGQWEEYYDIVAPFSPHQTALRFPLNYLDSLRDVSLMEFKTVSDEPGVDSVWVRVWFESHILADSWGELITPVSTYDVLRLKSTYYRADTIWHLSSGNWELYDVYDGARIEYDFLANNEGYPIVEFASNISGTYYVMFSYLLHYGPMPYIEENNADIGLQIYPVPAGESITACWDKERDGEIIIFDMMGRQLINNRFQGVKELKLNVSGLEEGSYLYSINFVRDDIVRTGKIIIK